jgi:hypothetical protein
VELRGVSWSKSFEEPNSLPSGTTIVTLCEAIAYLATSVPAEEHTMRQVRAAAHCLTEAAESGGQMLFARIGMMQAIDRHEPVVFKDCAFGTLHFLPLGYS